MSVQTETRHIETRKPGMRKDTEITTTTVSEPGTKDKSYAEVASATSGGKNNNKTSSGTGKARRASFSQQAQQMVPNVSKQQLAYGLPVVLAVLLSLLFLGFRSSSYFNPPPPPTMTQQFANKLDSMAHLVGGDYWEALKSKTFNIHQSVSELADSLTVNAPGLESLKTKANELKLEADKQYQAASAKSAEYAASAKKAGVKGAAKAGVKVDNIKENGQDAYARAQLKTGGVAEDVRHAVNEASEAVRHAAAETQEALRHRAAGVQNAAQHKVQDVKETVHNIKQTIKEHL